MLNIWSTILEFPVTRCHVKFANSKTQKAFAENIYTHLFGVCTSGHVIEAGECDHKKHSEVFSCIQEMQRVASVPEAPQALCKSQPWWKALDQTGYRHTIKSTVQTHCNKQKKNSTKTRQEYKEVS